MHKRRWVFRIFLFLKKRSTIRVRRILIGRWDAKFLFARKSEFFHFFPTSKFVFETEDLMRLKQFYEKHAELKTRIVENAEAICLHNFDLLGTGKRAWGKNIPWTTDIKSGFKWNNTFFKDIGIIDLTTKADVKLPWELSRFYHLTTLGTAYLLTSHLKYYQEFKSQITDWMDKNPVERSVNWTCTMEVAIRVCNWIFAYRLFFEELKKDADFRRGLDASLFEHGKFIFRNQEKSLRTSVQGNHYISNLVGLVFVGLHFGTYEKKARRWLTYAISELNKEIMSQIRSDGVDMETSTGYHRLVLEQLLWVQLLLEKNALTLGEKQKTRMSKMAYFVYSVTNAKGVAPLVGDYDNGRLFILEDYFNWLKTDFSTVLALSDYCLHTRYRKGSDRDYEELGLLLGKTTRIGKKTSSVVSDKIGSSQFPEGGFFVLRNDTFNCLIRCGRVAPGGAHSHNDQLSFTLFVYDISFVVDPGVYVYTGNKRWRDRFRSTDYHNTVCFGHIEQNDFMRFADTCFRMPEETFAHCLSFADGVFEGEHHGYQRKLGVVHTRSIRISDSSLYIQDHLFPEKEGKYANLIVDPEVTITKGVEGVFLEKEGILLKLSLKEYEVKQKYVAQGYGYIQPTWALTYKDDDLLIEVVNKKK